MGQRAEIRMHLFLVHQDKVFETFDAGDRAIRRAGRSRRQELAKNHAQRTVETRIRFLRRLAQSANVQFRPFPQSPWETERSREIRSAAGN